MGKNSKCTLTFPVSIAVQNSVRAIGGYCKNCLCCDYLAESAGAAAGAVCAWSPVGKLGA